MTGDDSNCNTSRRRTLKLLGIAGMGAITGSAPAAADGQYPYEFDTIVNMVDDAGADPTGEEEVGSLISEYANDNTLLYFPEGRYRLSQYRNYDSGYNRYENFGIVGDGSGKTTFVRPEGEGWYEGSYFERLWFEIRYGKNIYVEGFTLDISAEKTGGRFQVIPSGEYVVRDVRVHGEQDANDDGPLLFWPPENRDDLGLVEDVRAPDGGDGPGMFISPAGGDGTVKLRECTVVGFGAGLYGENVNPPAAVQVEGGYYANNNIAQVRLGTPRSYIRNATVEISEMDPAWIEASSYLPGNDVINQRGIRISSGRGVSIENCDVRVSTDEASDGAIVASPDGGPATIKNTRIRIDDPASTHAVNAKSNESDDDGIQMENVQITGDAEGGTAIELIDRENNDLRNVVIQQRGGDRDGIHAVQSDGYIENTVIHVSGDEIELEDSDFTTERVTQPGSN